MHFPIVGTIPHRKVTQRHQVSKYIYRLPFNKKITFRTYSINLSHILEQISLNSQNSVKFAVKIIDVSFKYFQICSLFICVRRECQMMFSKVFDKIFESDDYSPTSEIF
jgi:hypothetical protein